MIIGVPKEIKNNENRVGISQAGVTAMVQAGHTTLPYALKIANKGWQSAIKSDVSLARGVNALEGKLTYRAVSEALNLPYTPLGDVTPVPNNLEGLI